MRMKKNTDIRKKNKEKRILEKNLWNKTQRN